MKKLNQSNITKDKVNIGDIVSLNMKYSDEESEDIIVRLVRNNPNFKKKDIYEISTDSPVGKAIIDREVGDSVKCFVSKQEINIKINNIERDIQKIKVKQR